MFCFDRELPSGRNPKNPDGFNFILKLYTFYRDALKRFGEVKISAYGAIRSDVLQMLIQLCLEMLARPSVILGHKKFENHGDKHGTDRRPTPADGRKKSSNLWSVRTVKTINHTSIICPQRNCWFHFIKICLRGKKEMTVDWRDETWAVATRASTPTSSLQTVCDHITSRGFFLLSCF